MTLVKSMTGYGRAVETVNGREFTVELRSVDNRYLDCTVKLPRSLTFAEDAVKQAVKQTISRGKVDVFITVHSETAQDVKVTLNAAMVEGYLAAMKQMVTEYGVNDDISVSLLSRMNDVFTVEKPEVDEEQLLADLMGVVGKALIDQYKNSLPQDVYYVVTQMGPSDYSAKIKKLDDLLGRPSAGQISLKTKEHDFLKDAEDFAKTLKAE